METASSESRGRRVTMLTGLVLVIAVVIAGWALKATHTVSIPFTFAFFVTLLVHPVQRELSARLPRRLRWLGTVAALLVVLLALALVGGALALAVGTAVRQLPEHAELLQAKARAVLDWAHAQGLPVDQSGQALSSLGQRAAETGAAMAKGLGAALGFFVLVLFFVVFMLLEAPRWRTKATRVLPGDDGARVGALLAVPITTTLLMVCARIPSLERVAVMLGAEGNPKRDGDVGRHE